MTRTILLTLCCLLGGVAAAAIEVPTAELGQLLFESPQLGTRQRSCASCHPQGQGLKQVGDFTDAELKDIINACIRDAQGGTLFSTESQELDSLMRYVRTFQK